MKSIKYIRRTYKNRSTLHKCIWLKYIWGNWDVSHLVETIKNPTDVVY